MLKAVSLFSGCGGSDLGLLRTGVQIVWANDAMKAACDTYRANMPNTEVVCSDVEKIINFPSADILIGCYPCQGFSQGGKRDAEAFSNFLFLEFYRALKQIKPIAFIVENVLGMTYKHNRPLFNAQLEFYAQLGYATKWKCLDARDYGLAQSRKRVFIVGVSSEKSGQYQFPQPTHGLGMQFEWQTQGEVLHGFPEWPEGEYFDGEMNWYYMSRNRRRDWSECAPCVVASAKAVTLHPVSPKMERVTRDVYRFIDDSKPRRYSYRECAALQGFPLGYEWSIDSLISKYKIIGNAVPPLLMENVAKPLVQLIMS